MESDKIIKLMKEKEIIVKDAIIKGKDYEGKVIRVNKNSYVVEFYKHPMKKLGGKLTSTIAFK